MFMDRILTRPDAVGHRCLWSVTVALLALFRLSVLQAAVPVETGPEIASFYPLGGQSGQEVSITIRGRLLEGAYALWFESNELTAAVLDFDTEEPRLSSELDQTKKDSSKNPVELLAVRVRIDTGATTGPRHMRVITPRGISNSLKFWVHPERSRLERKRRHDLAAEAEPLEGCPLTVHGTIGRPREVDYYAFRVPKEESLRFEVRSTPLSDLALALYEPSGSWFSPDRTKRLAFSDEPVSYPGLSTEPVLTYQFEKSGRYLVRVSGFLGEGGPDHSYLLRITKTSNDTDRGGVDITTGGPDHGAWEERSWTRSLTSNRMNALWSRAGPPNIPRPSANEDARKQNPTGEVDALSAEIPELRLDGLDDGKEPPNISLPALLVGAIESPGDIDRIRFSAQVGDRIALDVETPQKTVPLFNPYLKIVDAQGVEVLTNVHSIINANNEIEKKIHPKTIHSFPRGGDFTLEIRDITASFGDPSMAYRVLIRFQVPHVGEIHVAEDHLNLVAGQATKLSVTTDQEEGFDGSIALTLSGLPPGVKAVTATETEPDSPPAVNEGRKERYVARNKKATFLLIAAANAPATRVPATVHLKAQPVIKGHLGPATAVKDVLLMVVPPAGASGQGSSSPVEKRR